MNPTKDWGSVKDTNGLAARTESQRNCSFGVTIAALPDDSDVDCR